MIRRAQPSQPNFGAGAESWSSLGYGRRAVGASGGAVDAARLLVTSARPLAKRGSCDGDRHGDAGPGVAVPGSMRFKTLFKRNLSLFKRVPVL